MTNPPCAAGVPPGLRWCLSIPPQRGVDQVTKLLLTYALRRLSLREARRDLDEPRQHVPRYSRSQEPDQLLGLDARPVPEDDEDLDVVLAELRRNADGGGLGHGWMVVDDLLHLEGGDVLASPPDGVLEPRVAAVLPGVAWPAPGITGT
jgi:hypothetical protein